VSATSILLLYESAVVLALLAPSAGLLTGIFNWLIALQYGLAILVLELFDIELPRGDSSTMSSPLVILALMTTSPLTTFAAAIIPVIVIQLRGIRSRHWSESAHEVLRRIIIVMVGVVMVDVFSVWFENTITVAIPVSLMVIFADVILAQLQSSVRMGVPLLQLVFGGARLQGMMIAANTSSALFGVVVYPDMNFWGVIVLVILLLTMRQAFSRLMSVRRAYQSTIEAFVRTIEAQNSMMKGHAERVSSLSVEAARRYGLRGKQLEQLAYAALLHDLGQVPLPEGDTIEESAVDTLSAADMLRGVGFLSEVVPVLELCDGTQLPDDVSESTIVMAYIVYVASRTDAMSHGLPFGGDTAHLEMLLDGLTDESLKAIERAFRRAVVDLEGPFFTPQRRSET